MIIEDGFIRQNDFIKYEINSIDEINMKSIDIVNKNKQLGLIEIEIEQFNEDISLIYNIRGYKTLKDYLLKPLSKKQAYSLLKNINNSLSMQSYILDIGVVSLETNLVFVKEINELPYIYFLYVPLNKEYSQDKDKIKKLIFSLIISIADNDLRSRALDLYLKDKLTEVIDLLKVEGIKFAKEEETLPYEREADFNEKIKEEDGTTCEVSEKETTLIEDYEETTLIDEEVDYSFNNSGRLLINNGGVFKEEHLYKDVTLIGRSLICDVVIQNKVVSKKHASIFKEGHNFYIKDEGSKNGTFVNDKKLRIYEKVKLKVKDKIKFGNVNCSFER